MRSKVTRNIIREIAEKENLSIKQVEDIVNAPFKFIVRIISSGNRWKLEFTDVRIFKLGLFRVTPSNREKTGRINKNLAKKREKLNRDKIKRPNYFPGSLDDKGVQENLESGPFDEKG